MFSGLILALCLPHHFKLSAFRYHLPARRSGCPYLPERALQGCPCPARVPLCQTFISQHPNGSVTQHKPSSVTRPTKMDPPHGFTGEIPYLLLSRYKNCTCFHILQAFDIYYSYTGLYLMPATCSKMSLEKAPSGWLLMFLPVSINVRPAHMHGTFLSLFCPAGSTWKQRELIRRQHIFVQIFWIF